MFKIETSLADDDDLDMFVEVMWRKLREWQSGAVALQSIRLLWCRGIMVASLAVGMREDRRHETSSGLRKVKCQGFKLP